MGDSKIPDGLLYSKEHEWLKDTGSEKALIGITDYAQKSLGDIVYVELPDVGRELSQNDTFGVVESVKAASDLYSACSGTVSRVNEELSATPEIVNQDPYEKGWMIELSSVNKGELASLMDAKAYAEYLASLEDGA